jgi:carboxylesterase
MSDYYENPDEFTLKGNKTGILLIHGVGCTPAEMRGMAEYLNQKGFTVSAIKLPGHGTNYKDLSKYTNRDWTDYAEEKLRELKISCDKVFVLGRSLGSLVASYIALNKKVDGLVIMSPPIFSNYLVFGASILGLFKHEIHFAKETSEDFFTRRDTKAPWTVLYYPKISVKTLKEVFKLMKYVKRNIYKVQIPVLVIQGKKDTVVPVYGAEKLFNLLTMKFKKLIYFTNSKHCPNIEDEREKVWEAVSNFIKENV